MNRYAWLAAGQAATFIAAFAACIGLIGRYMPGTDVGQLFMWGDIVLKLLMILILQGAVVVLGLGVASLFARNRTLRVLLAVTSVAALMFGGFGALYGYIRTSTAAASVGGVSFEVTAPGYAESLLCLSVGAFVGLIAAAFAAWSRMRVTA